MVDNLIVMLSGFPLGFFIPAAIADILKYSGLDQSLMGAPGHTVIWIVAATTGYFQWFVLLPWALRKFKKTVRR